MVISTQDKVFIQLSMQARQLLGYATDDDIEMKKIIAERAKTEGTKVELTFKNGMDETCLTRVDDMPVFKIKKIKKKTKAEKRQNG